MTYFIFKSIAITSSVKYILDQGIIKKRNVFWNLSSKQAPQLDLEQKTREKLFRLFSWWFEGCSLCQEITCFQPCMVSQIIYCLSKQFVIAQSCYKMLSSLETYLIRTDFWRRARLGRCQAPWKNPPEPFICPLREILDLQAFSIGGSQLGPFIDLKENNFLQQPGVPHSLRVSPFLAQKSPEKHRCLYKALNRSFKAYPHFSRLYCNHACHKGSLYLEASCQILQIDTLSLTRFYATPNFANENDTSGFADKFGIWKSMIWSCSQSF